MSMTDDFKAMYDLGYKHGYEIGLKDADIKQLEGELKEVTNG